MKKFQDVVSVIITTKNEAEKLPACLKSIQQQTYKHIEIIVVDNNSSDDTKQVALSFHVRLFDKGPERSAQRNYGASVSRGAFLLFLDADMELTPRVVEECMEAVREKSTNKGIKLIAVVVPEKSFGKGFIARCKAMERSFYLGVGWIESARFFRREAFLEIGGYDESLTGPEDFELAQRVKLRFGDTSTGRITAFILHNEGFLTLSTTLKKKFYYGKKMKTYRLKTSAKGYFGKQASIMERYRLFFSKSSIIRQDPITFLGMIVLKTLEMMALFFGSLSA